MEPIFVVPRRNIVAPPRSALDQTLGRGHEMFGTFVVEGIRAWALHGCFAQHWKAACCGWPCDANDWAQERAHPRYTAHGVVAGSKNR